jgi:glucose-6-phosphate isomerase
MKKAHTYIDDYKKNSFLPSTDFEGKIIVGEEELAEMLQEFSEQQLRLYIVSKSFTYKDIAKVAESLANVYSSDKKDPVWRDIRQDGIKAIQAFVSKHL